MAKFRSRTEKKRIRHAKARAAERYRIALTFSDLKNIVKLIQTREAGFIKKQSHTRSIWLVKYFNREMVVVYSKVYKEIITFLPNKNKSTWKVKELKTWNQNN